MEHSAYRKLDVWQVSMDLVEVIYRLSAGLPNEEKFGLVSQMRRAAVSIPANIAEGYGRFHRGDYVRHVSIARGSLMELETELTLAVRLGLLNRDEARPAWDSMQRIGAMLTKLLSSLRVESSEDADQ